MAESNVVSYDIQVQSGGAVESIKQFTQAAGKLGAAAKQFDNFSKSATRAFESLAKLNKDGTTIKINTKPAIESLDLLMTKLNAVQEKIASINGMGITTKGRVAGATGAGGTTMIASTGTSGGKNGFAPMATKSQGKTSTSKLSRAGSGAAAAESGAVSAVPVAAPTKAPKAPRVQSKNAAYKALGPSMLDSGGIGAFDFLKGMGIAYGITGLGSLIGSTIKESVNYDNIMQTVKNILGSHDKNPNFGGRFRGMEKTVRNVGVETKFTAGEVADASRYMAMAGLNLNAINRSIRPVSDVALIGDTDLGLASDLMTNVMTSYEVAPEKMRNLADVMTMTFTKSNTTLVDLAESMKYAGSVFKANGTPIEEALGALGVLGDAGMKGSHSGTTMRQLIANINKPTKSQEKAWKAVGVERTDKDGNIRPLIDIFTDLSKKNLDVGTYASLFRITAATGALTLAAHVDKWREIENENYQSSGMSQKLADAKKNTIEGLWAQLTSAFTEDGLQAFEGLQGQIRDMLKGVIDWLQKPEALNVIKSFGKAVMEIFDALKQFSSVLLEVWHRFGGLIMFWIKAQMYLSSFLIPLRIFRSLMNFGGLLTSGISYFATFFRNIGIGMRVFGSTSGIKGFFGSIISGASTSEAMMAGMAAKAAKAKAIMTPTPMQSSGYIFPKRQASGYLPPASGYISLSPEQEMMASNTASRNAMMFPNVGSTAAASRMQYNKMLAEQKSNFNSAPVLPKGAPANVPFVFKSVGHKVDVVTGPKPGVKGWSPQQAFVPYTHNWTAPKVGGKSIPIVSRTPSNSIWQPGKVMPASMAPDPRISEMRETLNTQYKLQAVAGMAQPMGEVGKAFKTINRVGKFQNAFKRRGAMSSAMATGMTSMTGMALGGYLGSFVGEEGSTGQALGSIGGAALGSVLLPFLSSTPVGWGVLAAGAIYGIIKAVEAHKDSVNDAIKVNKEWANSFKGVALSKVDISNPDAVMYANMDIFSNKVLSQNEKLEAQYQLLKRIEDKKRGVEDPNEDKTPYADTDAGAGFKAALNQMSYFNSTEDNYKILMPTFQGMKRSGYASTVMGKDGLPYLKFGTYVGSPIYSPGHVPGYALAESALAQVALDPNNNDYKQLHNMYINQLYNSNTLADMKTVMNNGEHYLPAVNKNLNLLEADEWPMSTIRTSGPYLGILQQQRAQLSENAQAFIDLVSDYERTGTVAMNKVQSFLYQQGAALLNPKYGLFGTQQWENAMKSMIAHPETYAKGATSNVVIDAINTTFGNFSTFFNTLNVKWKPIFMNFANISDWNAFMPSNQQIVGGVAGGKHIGDKTSINGVQYTWKPKMWGEQPQWVDAKGKPYVQGDMSVATVFDGGAKKHINIGKGGKGGSGSGSGSGSGTSGYKSHYNSDTAAPKQIIVKIGNLMNVKSVDLSNPDKAAVINDLKGELAQALIDVVHDFDESFNG